MYDVYIFVQLMKKRQVQKCRNRPDFRLGNGDPFEAAMGDVHKHAGMHTIVCTCISDSTATVDELSSITILLNGDMWQGEHDNVR